MLQTLWKHHKSKDHNFLHRSYIRVFFLNVTFTGPFFGRVVGHVPGHHKPQKWTIQTHSFSEHPKNFESTKYKYIFGSMEVGEILKKSYEFYQNRSQIWARTMILCSHTDPTMNSWSSWKMFNLFCGFFLTYPNSFLGHYICSSTTK